MKIAFLGNFSEWGYEGLMVVVKSLKEHFSKEHVVRMSPEDADIINVHSSGFFESISYFFGGKRVIYSLHSNIVPMFYAKLKDVRDTISFAYSDESDHFIPLKRYINFTLAVLSNLIPLSVKRFFLGRMGVVVLPSVWMKRKLNLKNSVVIRHGIDVRRFRRIRTPASKDLRIRYFGHASPSKGLIETIKAFSMIDGCRKEIFSTKKNRKIEANIRDIDKSIVLHGPVDDIVSEYNRSDIIVAPYRNALAAIGTPLVLLEAMACKRAIITSDLPHLREICGDSVLYVKPNSVRGIVRAIRKLKDPVLRKSLGEKARKRALEYSQERMFREYEKLYSSFLDDNKDLGPHE